MGCIYSVVCSTNGKIAVFTSEKEYTRAYSWQLNLLQRGKHEMKDLQKDFDSFGASKFNFRCHDGAVPVDQLHDVLLEYAVDAFATYRPELGYNQELAEYAPPDPEPMPIRAAQMTPAERAHRAEIDGLRSEIADLKSMLRQALGQPVDAVDASVADEEQEELLEPPPVASEPPDTFTVETDDPEPPKAKRAFAKAKPVLRLEPMGRNEEGEPVYSMTGEFPSISAAVRDCKGTASELRKAINTDKLYKGCRWVFKDAEARAA